MKPRRLLPLLGLLLLPGLACGLLSGASSPTEVPAEVQEDQQDTQDPADDTNADESAQPTAADDSESYADDDALTPAGPADVPVFDGPKSALDYADATTRSYQLDQASYDEVVGFYQREMLANGWEEDTSQVAVVSEDAAVLYFVREGRAASVTISVPTGTESVMVMVLVATR